jgi:hypothetical protein
VDVEQRHDRKAAVLRRKFERAGDGSRRCAEVPLGERHELRPGGRPGGVEQERCLHAIVGPGTSLGTDGADRAELGAATVERHELEDAEPEPLGHQPAGGAGALRHDDRGGAEIRERELELLLAVGGVERSAAGSCRNAEERGRELRPVGVDDRDTVAR